MVAKLKLVNHILEERILPKFMIWGFLRAMLDETPCFYVADSVIVCRPIYGMR